MSIESIAVSSFMTTNIITQTEDQNIRAVSRTIYENNIGSIVIATPTFLPTVMLQY